MAHQQAHHFLPNAFLSLGSPITKSTPHPPTNRPCSCLLNETLLSNSLCSHAIDKAPSRSPCSRSSHSRSLNKTLCFMSPCSRLIDKEPSGSPSSHITATRRSALTQSDTKRLPCNCHHATWCWCCRSQKKRQEIQMVASRHQWMTSCRPCFRIAPLPHDMD
jgi:hypothetical protein